MGKVKKLAELIYEYQTEATTYEDNMSLTAMAEYEKKEN